MVNSETIEAEFSETKEKIEEKREETKEKIDEKKEETKEKLNEQKEKFNERREKGKNIADNVVNDLYKTIDEFKENLKNMQKNAEYKKSTVQTIDVDLVETKDTYFIKAAVPGAKKEEISIEAGDNDITIETTFKPFIEEFNEEDEAEVIISAIKSGRCVKTVRFSNSIDIEQITAKFTNGIIKITIPKLIIPKHKVNVE